MPHVSRPLLGVLIATVIGAALWMVVLKKSVTGTGATGGSTSTNSLQSAIDKAHQAVTTSDKASVAHGGAIATTPTASQTLTTATVSSATQTATISPATHTVTTASATTAATASHVTSTTTVHHAVITAHAASTPAQREAVVVKALNAHKVVAILFYNPPATDDAAVKAELATVPSYHGRVVKIAAPLRELMDYTVITFQVPITGSPTLVLIDGTHHASTIVGFSDRFEIDRRVAAALTVK